MSEQPTRKIDAWIMPDGQLMATDEKVKEMKSRIGTGTIAGKRRASLQDTLNDDGSKNDDGWDAYLAEKFVDKEGLSDRDLQAVTAARLDEKILDLGESDMDKTAMIKAYDDLSRIKSLIQFTEHSVDSPLQQAIHDAREAFTEKGDEDMAAIADAASDFLHEVSLEALDLQGENGGDNATSETKRVIDEHNERVASNKTRLSIEEQRRMAS